MDANMKVCIFLLFIWIGTVEEVRRCIECGMWVQKHKGEISVQC